MERIELTTGGPNFSRIVAGIMRLREWEMDTPALLDFIHQCLDLGITTFDHADIYGSYTVEALFGKALAAEPSLRNRIEIVTKCGIQLVSRIGRRRGFTTMIPAAPTSSLRPSAR